jgi:hypothetical protein
LNPLENLENAEKARGRLIGRVACSTDGATWTEVGDTKFGVVLSIAYGGGKFVAVGDEGKAAYWEAFTLALKTGGASL